MAQTVASMNLARDQRWLDAKALYRQSGRRTGCLYLCGYVIEIGLKAAYFELATAADVELAGKDLTQLCRHPERLPEFSRARADFVAPYGHCLPGWLSLLEQARSRSGRNTSNDLMLEVSGLVATVIWSPGLRYAVEPVLQEELNSVYRTAERIVNNNRQLVS